MARLLSRIVAGALSVVLSSGLDAALAAAQTRTGRSASVFPGSVASPAVADAPIPAMPPVELPAAAAPLAVPAALNVAPVSAPAMLGTAASKVAETAAAAAPALRALSEQALGDRAASAAGRGIEAALTGGVTDGVPSRPDEGVQAVAVPGSLGEPVVVLAQATVRAIKARDSETVEVPRRRQSSIDIVVLAAAAVLYGAIYWALHSSPAPSSAPGDRRGPAFIDEPVGVVSSAGDRREARRRGRVSSSPAKKTRRP